MYVVEAISGAIRSEHMRPAEALAAVYKLQREGVDASTISIANGQGTPLTERQLAMIVMAARLGVTYGV